jgi:pimeloyl-ACP methyl ester carboxylesterase
VQQTRIATTLSPPIGRRYAVAGRQLALHRAGSGAPSVVFMPGAGLVGLDYLNVATQIARSTTAVLYDRAGTGWSDAVALPRTAAAVAEELRALLEAAEVPGPYLLVGHSLGGAYIRRYAQLFPDEVAGLLFLDPAHEGYADFPRQGPLAQVRMALAMLPALLNLRKFYGPKFEAMLRAWPDGLRQTLIDYHLAAWRKTLDEARNLQSEILGEIGRGGPLPDVPLIVLTAMGIDPFQAAFMPEEELRALNGLKAPVYEAFARSVPHGENRALADAGHSTLHTDRPYAVVQAVHDILAAAHRATQMSGGGRLESCRRLDVAGEDPRIRA